VTSLKPLTVDMVDHVVLVHTHYNKSIFLTNHTAPGKGFRHPLHCLSFGQLFMDQCQLKAHQISRTALSWWW